MTEVFISYSRSDRPVAEAIASGLKILGVDVWWDHDLLGGDDYRKRISETLARADVVIVIWSRQSVESQFVIGEAAAARDKKLLVPITIDRQEPPIDFRPVHTIDISSWLPSDPIPDVLLRAVGERLGRELVYGASAVRSGSVSRLARQATQAWYYDFESILFYFIGQGFACSLIDIPVVIFASNSGTTTTGSAWPSWAPYLLALLNGMMVAALYMRPALETRRFAHRRPPICGCNVVEYSSILYDIRAVRGRWREATPKSCWSANTAPTHGDSHCATRERATLSNAAD